MTLDEAIAHAREVAKRNREQWKNCPADRRDIEHQTCEQCAEEHEHLATWLEDLKRRREYDDELMGSGALNNAYKSGYEKAIDDFVTKLKDSLANNYKHFISTDADGFEWLTTDAVETHIDNVADQLNAGTSND